MSTVSQEQDVELTDRFGEFLRRYYDDEIKDLAQHYPTEKRSLYVEWSDLYRFDPNLADDFENQPEQFQRYAEEALRLYDLPIDVTLKNAHVRVTDSTEYLDRLRLFDLEAKHIGNYVAVSGQLSKVTEKKPLLVDGAFECQLCGTITKVPQSRQSASEPHQCQGCERQGPFRVNFEQSEFVDQRKVKLESPPDEAAQAEGTSTTVYVTDDLCDFGGENGLPDRAGERCTVLGIRKLDDSNLGSRDAEPEFDTWIDGKAIVFHGQDQSDVDIEAHKDEIVDHANCDDPVTFFKENIVPGLEADEDLDAVLEASVAWLFGSYRVEQDEGEYRGDIHVGVIGDPGTGKSTLLGELSKISPLCEFRSGTGLSKVGLTAAAVREEFAGKSKWTLQPGILPRANGGHCIIDEVDDVIDEKTKAIHDALEGKQKVKVDKAGISADLETRAGLLASGNPTHGRFDRYEPVAEQVDLDPALISRMDVLLDLPDNLDRETDRMKAEHYLESYDEVSRKQLYEKGELDDKPEMQAANRDVSVEVLRAWVAYARENVFPRLTPEAKASLKEFYLSVRNLNDGYESSDEKSEGAIPATPRTLGAGVRLATAFARCELSDTVELHHVERAKSVTRDTIGLNWDPETGEFDSGKTDTGNLQRWQRVKRVISDVQGDDSANIDEVIDEIQSRIGLSESKAEHEIQKLKDKGAIYEPKTDELKTT
jgi:replicative DNA helicase Mcm